MTTREFSSFLSLMPRLCLLTILLPAPNLQLDLMSDANRRPKENGMSKDLSLEVIAANNRDEFGRSAREYVAYLLGATQKLTRFTSDIVRGLGSFDLEILLVDPVEQATYCYKQLFTSFRLRGVVDPGEEPVYTDEYFSFVDELRRLHLDMQQPKLLIADAIDFISIHLTRIFRLSCLCLDEPRFSFPPVKFGSVKTDDPTCIMFDVLASIQSYLGNVSRGLDALTPDASISRFLLLEQTFGHTAHDNTYSPWDSFDQFGRQQIRDGLSSSLRISTKSGTSRPSTSKSPKVVRVSPGKTVAQHSVSETKETSSSKACSSSGKSANP